VLIAFPRVKEGSQKEKKEKEKMHQLTKLIHLRFVLLSVFTITGTPAAWQARPGAAEKGRGGGGKGGREGGKKKKISRVS